MNSEERPATSRTAYKRTINILCLPALSNHILHVLSADAKNAVASLGRLAGPASRDSGRSRLHQSSSENLNDFRKIVYNRRPVNLNKKRHNEPNFKKLPPMHKAST